MDSRDLAAVMSRWYRSFDERTMIAIHEDGDGETHEIKCEYRVCGLCEGKGKHVNPAIDSHGISMSEFHDDPDFAEDYFGGLYDIPCNQCHGTRVEPWPVEESDQELVEDFLRAECDYARICEAERRFGC